MRRLGKAIAVSAVAIGALGVRMYVARYSVDNVAGATNLLPSFGSTGPLTHFDHRPRHDGLVLMNGDTHFEVVLDGDGRYSVYFSDAVRTALPASIASQVLVVVTPPGRAPEATPLQIDATGARWIGRGTPIDDPNAIVRITYTAGEKPYWIDVPASAWNGVISSRPR
jgi:hypothetical protein